MTMHLTPIFSKYSCNICCGWGDAICLRLNCEMILLLSKEYAKFLCCTAQLVKLIGTVAVTSDLIYITLNLNP